MKIPKMFFSLIGFLMLIPIYQGCVEQVDAEFDLQSDIIFVDGYVLTEPGTSSVTISKSTFQNQTTYQVVNVLNASVQIENINTGEIIEFIEDVSGIYGCPSNFAASTGEEWKLYVELEDGRRIESNSQIVTSPVLIDSVHAVYSPEIEFNTQFDRLVPGHRLSIDWQDPANEENFQLWKYRTFEPLFVCKTCQRGVLRNGECEPTGLNWGPDYYSYVCIPDCWQINIGKELPIFNDRLEDGEMITEREIAILPMYQKPSILVEVQQFSLDESAYEYFKVVNSQVSQSGGLNAPPPAALLGNLFNPNDASDLILGNFTAAGISTKRLFIDRSQITEYAITSPDPIILENCPTCPTSYPCMESFTRTGIKPNGWP
ncbi:MAG: DUF4249 domain-containing protein [Saprospiraceae bacterium]|nr:DUF4249 domain-containing protein [Saprospiraceae bacterium]MDG2418169.1 DUF4249 domain-containing protein [Saprospiraceae bacterium]